MATRKKTKKKSARSKKSNRKKAPPKQPAQKRGTPKTLAKTKGISKKAAGKKKSLAKTRSGQTVNENRRNAGRRPGSSPFSPVSSGLQSGDMQGLSNIENVDSESVDELLEEGNAFEAGIVSGVEDSRAREGKEVRTREVPEDDVPGEYLDEE